MRNSVPFLVPIILSVHMPVGVRSEPVSLDAPVTRHGFSQATFLLNRTDCRLDTETFRFRPLIDPYIREFVSPLIGHSHHRHFVDPRRVICTYHLWDAFVSRFRAATADFRRLHRASDGLRFRICRQSEYQRARFRTLPLHSTPWITSSPRLFAVCLTFSVRNESHAARGTGRWNPSICGWP